MFVINSKQDGIAYYEAGATHGRCICHHGASEAVVSSLPELVRFYNSQPELKLPDPPSNKVITITIDSTSSTTIKVSCGVDTTTYTLNNLMEWYIMGLEQRFLLESQLSNSLWHFLQREEDLKKWAKP